MNRDFLDRFSEGIRRYVLENGMTVIQKSEPGAGLASVQLWLKTGSIHEHDFLGSGLSHFLEHMIFKGTEKRPGNAISREVQELGGYINAYTSFDRTVYYIELPAESAPDAIDILCDGAFRAALPKDDVITERDVILREIDMGRDDPDSRVSEALFQTAFRTHPYQYPVIGHRQLFERIDQATLERYHRNRYTPANAVLVVVGDFDDDWLEEKIQVHADSYGRTPVAPVQVTAEREQMAVRKGHLFGDFGVTRGYLAWQIPGITSDERAALAILAGVLGSGQGSVLWQSVRNDQSLVSYVGAAAWNPGDIGLLYVNYLSSKHGALCVEEALRSTVSNLRDVHDLDERITRARRMAQVGELNRMNTISRQASHLGGLEVAIGDLDFPKTFFAELDCVSREDILLAADKWLRPGREIQVALQPDKFATPTVQMAKRSSASGVTVETLSNGVRFCCIPDDRIPKAHIRLLCGGGSLLEQEGNRGITMLGATMLTRDAGNRTHTQVAELVESKGASFREFCGNNSFGFALECMNDDFSTALDVFTSAVFHPTFSEGTFNRERASQIDEIREAEDDIDDFGITALRREFFGSHPLNTDSVGIIADLETIGPEACKNHLLNAMGGSNLVVSLAGVFSQEDRNSLVDALGRISKKKPTLNREGFSAPAFVDRKLLPLDREQSVVFQAFHDAPITREDHVVGDLITEILNEMSGSLFTRVREEKGMAYYVGARRVVGTNAAMFYLTAGTNPKFVDDVYTEFDAELDRFRGGNLDPSEIERCKRRLKVQKMSSLQAIGGKAMQAALNIFYDFPADDWKTYPQRIDAITVDDIARYAKTFFDPNFRYELVVGHEPSLG